MSPELTAVLKAATEHHNVDRAITAAGRDALIAADEVHGLIRVVDLARSCQVGAHWAVNTATHQQQVNDLVLELTSAGFDRIAEAQS
jgi:precorrin-6B methylase 1